MELKTPFLLLISLGLPTLVFGECTCDYEAIGKKNGEALKLKLAAFGSILGAGALGVSLPLFGRKIPALRPENDIFFMIKAFAAGVILATGFIHILPDAFEDLSSPCLAESPWGNFPFVGFVAMVAAIGTLMINSLATGYYKRMHSNGARKPVIADEETASDQNAGSIVPASHGYDHGHGHGHGHGHDLASSSQSQLSTSELIRHRVVAQVLELGIVVHSVIIGITLGASQSPDTITPLIAALSFHQFFEGMGLGGCIAQAKFKLRSILVMAAFFSLTTPLGIAIGIGISSAYNENSPNSLILEGIFNAAAAGILIYLALVDLLAADFMNPRMQNNLKLQLGAYISLLLGAGCMSVLAKWA